MLGVYDTKSNYVFDYLKDRILKGHYPQGQSIVISTVAKELKVSTIPVREALTRLESEGLVELFPHKGARVVTFDENMVTEVLAIRAVLEGFAAGMTAKTITPKTLDKLRELNEQMRQSASDKDDGKFTFQNRKFHELLYENVNYPTLKDMIFKLWSGGGWSKSLFAFFPEKMDESLQEHEDIITALEKRDGALAEKLTRAHKEKNIEYYLRLSK